MPTTALSTPVSSPQTLATPVDALDLETRMAGRLAQMNVALEAAALAIDINTAHIPTEPVDLTEVVTAPVAVPQTPMTPRTAPVADLLRRAQERVLRPNGWSRDTGTNEAGGDCLEYAMQAEARSDAEEQEARILLRQVVGSGDPLTHINRQLANASQAGQLLGQAADLAHARHV